MPTPQFTATKGDKSATFRIFDLVRDLQPVDDEGATVPHVRFDLDLRIPDPLGDGYTWVRDQSQWPAMVRATDRTYSMAEEAAAVSALGSALNGKSEAQRAILVAVKCFDLTNGCTSTIDWGT